MIEEILRSIFRFNLLDKTGWAIIDLCTVAAVLVALVLFLFRYFFHYGLLRTFGLSLAIGAIWFVISSATMTVFSDNLYAGAAVTFLVSGVWFVCMLLTVIIRHDNRGPFVCFVISAFIIVLSIVACFPGRSFMEAFEKFGRTLFER